MTKFLVSATFILLFITTSGCARKITPASTASIKNINQQFLQAESQANGPNKNHGQDSTGLIAVAAPQPNNVMSIPHTAPEKTPSGHVISKPTLTNKVEATTLKPPSITKGNHHHAANVASKNSAGLDTNFPPLPTSNQGQSNVKQLVQYYNGRDQAAQSGSGNNAGPHKYSAVVAGTHKNQN